MFNQSVSGVSHQIVATLQVWFLVKTGFISTSMDGLCSQTCLGLFLIRGTHINNLFWTMSIVVWFLEPEQWMFCAKFISDMVWNQPRQTDQILVTCNPPSHSICLVAAYHTTYHCEHWNKQKQRFFLKSYYYLLKMSTLILGKVKKILHLSFFFLQKMVLKISTSTGITMTILKTQKSYRICVETKLWKKEYKIRRSVLWTLR